MEVALKIVECSVQTSAYKRSPLSLKRHISPSFDVEEDVGNMRALMDIGKRQVSVADDVGRQMQVSIARDRADFSQL